MKKNWPLCRCLQLGHDLAIRFRCRRHRGARLHASLAEDIIDQSDVPHGVGRALRHVSPRHSHVPQLKHLKPGPQQCHIATSCFDMFKFTCHGSVRFSGEQFHRQSPSAGSRMYHLTMVRSTSRSKTFPDCELINILQI